MDPQQILAALAEMYATCLSYRDSGRVVTKFFHQNPRPRTVSKPFTTASIRPDRFRFEYKSRRGEDEWDRHITWAGGAEVRTWWDVRPGIERPQSLSMALPSGVSGGSAHTIPAMLLPQQVGGRRLTDLVDVTSLGDEALDGVTCYRLSGRFVPYPTDPAAEERRRAEAIRLTGRHPERAENGPITLWIDRGTLLVRRIEHQTQFETFRTEQVTEYEPAVGVTIADEELRFDPPE
jgi:outer membrane lipoprotein-sorting protein